VTRGGYIPSTFDGRDVAWPKRTRADRPDPGGRVQLPRRTAWDQGTDVDCCTSCALVAALEIFELRGGAEVRLSPLFHYYYARGTRRSLGPLRLRSALQAAAAHGVCRLENHNPPFSVAGALERPSRDAILDARSRRLPAYDATLGHAGYYTVQRNDRLRNWKEALELGQPILVGLWTQTSYWRGEGMTENESAPSPSPHAVLIVGFDDDRAVFRVLDSRGTSFADRGEWDLSYAVAETDRIAESWTIRMPVSEGAET
jgi:hypothetical protein